MKKSRVMLKPRDCRFFLFLASSVMCAANAADEYSFDMSAYEKSPYEFGGYAEIRWEHFQFNQQSNLFRLNYFGKPPPSDNDRYTGSLQLEGRYSHDALSMYARLNPEIYNDDFGDDSDITTHEAYVSWKVATSTTLDAGKKLFKWGKGYAWNPVGFIERPKDPNEPDLAREGFTAISADWIYSRAGDLQTISVTPVYLPVTSNFNKDFGPVDDNFAAKLYLLYKDTDIDFMFLSGGSRSVRYGADISRNISTNFEIHAELARLSNVMRKLLTESGNLTNKVEDIDTGLIGIRYLTEADTTYIAEYYYNGAGYSEDQMRIFYRLIENIPSQSDPAAALAKAQLIAATGYLRQTPMQDYLYLRATQKEPFDILYYTPALTAIINLQDHSYNISPELAYTGITNLELRLKLNFLKGSRYTEFGEKQNDMKYELRARYFF